jgi:CBS domain-containing protein
MTTPAVANRTSTAYGPANVVHGQSPLSALVSRAAVTVAADCTLADAVATMEAAGVSALLVGEQAAIITERDIARALGHGVPVDEIVGGVATPHPVVVSASMSVVDGCAVMLNEQIRHLVVETDHGPAVLSLRDVAAVLLQSSDSQVWLSSLRVQIETPAETWLG